MGKKWNWVRKFLGDATATCGTLWLVLGPLGVWVPQAKPSGIEAYGVFIAAGLVVAWWRNRHKKSINITIPGTDSEITVESGDIFKGEGLKFISVNEYFDCELGGHVSAGSLHGQFINKILKMDKEEWRRIVREGLQEIEPIEKNVERRSGERDRYEIGTTVRTKTGGPGQEYMLVVLTRTDIVSLKARATLKDLCICAEAICKEARNYSNGRRVDIPMIGSGLSNIGLPAQRLLDILILFVMHHTKKQEIAKHIRIVVSKKILDRVDLHEIERRWKQ